MNRLSDGLFFLRSFSDVQGALFLRKVRVCLDFANLLNMALGMSGDFEHPLPAIDRCLISKAVRAQIVVGGVDVSDHGGVERLELGPDFAQVLIRIDLLVPATGFGMHHAVDAVPHNVGIGCHRFLVLHIGGAP